MKWSKISIDRAFSRATSSVLQSTDLVAYSRMYDTTCYNASSASKVRVLILGQVVCVTLVASVLNVTFNQGITGSL